MVRVPEETSELEHFSGGFAEYSAKPLRESVHAHSAMRRGVLDVKLADALAMRLPSVLRIVGQRGQLALGVVYGPRMCASQAWQKFWVNDERSSSRRLVSGVTSRSISVNWTLRHEQRREASTLSPMDDVVSYARNPLP